MARPSGAFDASRYFRGPVDLGFFNVGSDRVRALAKEMYQKGESKWALKPRAA
jgi:hypothetical protein